MLAVQQFTYMNFAPNMLNHAISISHLPTATYMPFGYRINFVEVCGLKIPDFTVTYYLNDGHFHTALLLGFDTKIFCYPLNICLYITSLYQLSVKLFLYVT